MRCFKECNSEVIKLGDQIHDLDHMPMCDKCGGVMRPHVLWFDESYNEQFYCYDTVKTYVERDVDAVLVIGTALETALASSLVTDAIADQILIFEFNTEPVIPKG